MTAALILRVVHILFGVFWAGAAMMLAGFIEPAIQALGPDGGRFLQRMVGPGRFGPFMSAAAVLTVLSGAVMLWFEGSASTTIIVGSIAGVVALIGGLVVNAPTAARLTRLNRAIVEGGAPPTANQIAEVAKLRRRLHYAGLASAFVLSISVIAMASARYL